MALLFRLEHRSDPAGLESLIDEVIGWFRLHTGYDELKGLFTELVRQAIEGIGGTMSVPDDLVEMKTMLATQGEAWKRQWKAEGKAEGRAEGEAAMLVRLLERRFGALPAWAQSRIATADTTSLEEWCLRVLDAKSIDEVFG